MTRVRDGITGRKKGRVSPQREGTRDRISGSIQQMLDLLAQYDAQATFLVLGKSANTYPDFIRAEASGGHYVANHTYSHPSL